MRDMTDIPKYRTRTKELIELHFFDDFLRTYLVFIIGPRDKFVDFLKDHYLKESVLDELNLQTASGYCIRLNEENCDIKGQNCYAIWLKERHLPCLVHELTHLTHIAFDETGIPIAVQNQETFAYYIEMWVKRITEMWTVPREKKSGKVEEKQVPAPQVATEPPNS